MYINRVYRTEEETNGWRFHDFEKILVHVLDGILRIAIINKNTMEMEVREVSQNSSVFINCENYYAWRFLTGNGRLLVLSDFGREESERDERRLPLDHFGEYV